MPASCCEVENLETGVEGELLHAVAEPPGLAGRHPCALVRMTELALIRHSARRRAARSGRARAPQHGVSAPAISWGRYKAELRRRVRDAYTPRRSPERRAGSFGSMLRALDSTSAET